MGKSKHTRTYTRLAVLRILNYIFSFQHNFIQYYLSICYKLKYICFTSKQLAVFSSLWFLNCTDKIFILKCTLDILFLTKLLFARTHFHFLVFSYKMYLLNRNTSIPFQVACSDKFISWKYHWYFSSSNST